MLSICLSATALVQPAAFPSHSVASRGAVLRAPAPIAAEVDLKEVLNKWDNDEDGDSKECMQGAELEFFTDRIESPDVLPALEQLMDEVLGDCDEACATIEKMKKKVGA